MAHLLVRKGANPGYRFPLEKDTIVIGRSIDCDVPIASPSISRQHARLIRLQDRWFIEDMLSRNGTHVNDQRITVRSPLKRHDTIRICDFEAIFQDGPSAPTAPAPVPTRSFEIETDDIESSSQLMALVSHGWKVFEMQSAESLRTILHISNRLSSTLELDQLLPKIADQVFNLFPNADRCFVVVEDPATGNLVQEVTRTRTPEEMARARYSRTIVRQCTEGKKAYLNEDITSEKPGNSGSSMDMQTRSIMCAPMCTAEERILGAIQLDTQDFSKKFSGNDLKLLVGLANQATIALQNAQLYQEMQHREQMERDLELAAQVQRSILPEALPRLAGFEFHTHYASALQVGGDYFDFIPLSDQRLAITLGDVAGKSVPAAILMSRVNETQQPSLSPSEKD
jgi:pSer/pThr/pTyr-binding forkhead associated (FHA) protein